MSLFRQRPTAPVPVPAPTDHAGGAIGAQRRQVAEAEARETAARDQYEAAIAIRAAARGEMETTTDHRKYGELMDLVAVKERQVAELGPVAYAAFERASGERMALAWTERTAAQLRGEAYKLCQRLHEIAVPLEQLTGDTCGLEGVE